MAQTGNLETVRGLTELDGRLDAADARGQGIVELSSARRDCVGTSRMCRHVATVSARRDCVVLAYYTRMDSERLNVWKRLVKLMKSDFEEESEPAAWCTHQLTLLFEDVNDTAGAGVDLFTSRFITVHSRPFAAETDRSIIFARWHPYVPLSNA